MLEMRSEVEKILKAAPPTRDDDYLLLMTMCRSRGVDLQAMDAYTFLLKMSRNQLPDLESVARCRRSIQENNVTLRGKLYEGRHKKETEVRKEINDEQARKGAMSFAEPQQRLQL
jgi:hypothetical protein